MAGVSRPAEGGIREAPLPAGREGCQASFKTACEEHRMDLEYAMIVEPSEDKDGKYFCAYIPDLPGCTTMGATLDELRANAVDAVSGHLAALRQLGKPVPAPRSRIETVTVPAS
jgi:predicted RNase H-like HicB family nuclease